jgi:hypothetical protein
MNLCCAASDFKAIALTLVFLAASLLAQAGPSWSEHKLRDRPQAQGGAALVVSQDWFGPLRLCRIC